MALYGGAVPWWRVVRADGALLPGHELRALDHYRDGGHPAARGAARRAEGHMPRLDMRRARWDGVTGGAAQRELRQTGVTPAAPPIGIRAERGAARPCATYAVGRACVLRVPTGVASGDLPSRRRADRRSARAAGRPVWPRPQRRAPPAHLTTSTPTRTGEPRELLLLHPARCRSPGGRRSGAPPARTDWCAPRRRAVAPPRPGRSAARGG